MGRAWDVYQGQSVNSTEEFPDAAVEVFKQLIDLASNAQAGAKDLVEKAGKTVQDVASSAAQPDLTVVGNAQNMVIKIAAFAAVAFAASKVFGR